MIDPVPALGLDQIPPGFISLIAGHNDTLSIHARVLDRQLLLDLPDTASDDGDRSETFLERDSIAPATEISVPDVDSDVLFRIHQRHIPINEEDLMATHRRDRLIILETEGRPKI